MSSLQKRFLIPSLVIAFIFTVALVFWLPDHIESFLVEELTRRGKLAAEVLDKSSIGALTIYDKGALNQLAKGFIRSEDILYILILDKDGKNIAESGIDKQNFAAIESRLSQIAQSETDYLSRSSWPATGETLFHIARPVFYEQLRIGTIVLGISGHRIDLIATQLRLQMGLLCGVVLIISAGLSSLLAWSLSRPIRKIASGLETMNDRELEKLAGTLEEFNLLIESIQKQKNSFKASLGELETQKIELETDTALIREENASLSSRVSVLTKQAETLQEKIRLLEEQSNTAKAIMPLVEFATGAAPEIDASMQHIARSAEKLHKDFEQLNNLIHLYERAIPLTPEDLEVIQQYKDFIQYEKIMESVDQLVTTIRGGAGWTEQLAGLLKQLSPGPGVNS